MPTVTVTAYYYIVTVFDFMSGWCNKKCPYTNYIIICNAHKSMCLINLKALIALYTELADVDPLNLDPDLRETTYSLLNGSSMVPTPPVQGRGTKTLLLYVFGTITVIISMVGVFTALIAMIKKLQKKRKANHSNRLQNIYSKDPTAPVYEIVEGNFSSHADINIIPENETDVLNVVIDENESISSLSIENTK